MIARLALTALTAFLWFWFMFANLTAAGLTKGQRMALEPRLTESEAEHLTFRDVVVTAIFLSVLSLVALWFIWRPI